MDYFKRTLWEGKPCYRKESSTFVARLREFSNADLHNPNDGLRVDYAVDCEGESYVDADDYLRHRGHSIFLYANGHVSLEFRYFPDHILYEIVRSRIRRVDLTCLVAVVDAEDCVRFPQSFAFTHDAATDGKIPDFRVADFISRDFLLTAAGDDLLLLPDDTLTLRVDVVLAEYISGECKYVDVWELVRSSFRTEGGETKRHYLLLDSVVAERLRVECKYFERLSDNPLAEGNSQYTEIPDDEYYDFLNMVIILWRLALYNCTMAFTFQQILDVYATADYYGLETVLDTCRRFLRLSCRTEDDVLAISRLADQYDDPLLLEIAAEASATVEKLPCGVDSEIHPGEPDEEWTCTPRYDDSNGVYFHFQPRLKTASQAERNDDINEDISEISDCYL